MNQVSRPMQIALAAVLVFSLAWFAVLRPKDPAEDVAATPATAVQTTPASEPGGAAAQTDTGKLVETAKTGAAEADAAVKARESQTGDDDATPAATATPKADTPEATTPKASETPAATSPAEAEKASEDSGTSAAQKRAFKVIEKIAADQAKQRAVVVLVWAKSGREDKIVHRRIRKEIDRRGGKVRVYMIPVADVGRYDGLLRGLSLGQIPSTIVIAPDNQAKVLGGVVSTARIDRLTSSATLTKPVGSGKKK